MPRGASPRGKSQPPAGYVRYGVLVLRRRRPGPRASKTEGGPAGAPAWSGGRGQKAAHNGVAAHHATGCLGDRARGLGFGRAGRARPGRPKFRAGCTEDRTSPRGPRTHGANTNAPHTRSAVLVAPRQSRSSAVVRAAGYARATGNLRRRLYRLPRRGRRGPPGPASTLPMVNGGSGDVSPRRSASRPRAEGTTPPSQEEYHGWPSPTSAPTRAPPTAG